MKVTPLCMKASSKTEGWSCALPLGHPRACLYYAPEEIEAMACWRCNKKGREALLASGGNRCEKCRDDMAREVMTALDDDDEVGIFVLRKCPILTQEGERAQ